MSDGGGPARPPDAEALAGIVAAQPAGALIVDAEAVVRFANPAAAELLSRPIEDLVGETLGLPLVADGVTDLNVRGHDGAVRTVAMRTTRLDWPEAHSHLVTLFDVTGRARRYEHEHRLVESLQRSVLLDEMPIVPGVKLAARYLPGGSAGGVGGDWYDAIPLPGGRLGIAIGDVAGHGVESAALMGQLRNALRAYALEDHTPGVVLQRLDDLLEPREPERTATLSYLIHDPADGRLSFGCAGHLPPLVVEPDGKVRFVDGGRSLPLGAGGTLDDRDEGVAELVPGSLLILYTDGLVERRSAPLDESLERLAAAAAVAGHDPDEVCDAILAQLLGDESGQDDVAILVARTAALDTNELELTLPTRPAALRTARRMLDRWLEHAGANDQERQEILLATHEACSNAIEHGYRFAEGEYLISASRVDGRVTMTVRDRGRWREPDDGAERGRGFVIMRALMDDLEIVPGEAGSTVRMTRRLRPAVPARWRE